MNIQTNDHPISYREAERLSPKSAVASHYYLEYLEGGNTARYGNFMFDIA
jgi:hypothetical protein